MHALINVLKKVHKHFIKKLEMAKFLGVGVRAKLLILQNHYQELLQGWPRHLGRGLSGHPGLLQRRQDLHEGHQPARNRDLKARGSFSGLETDGRGCDRGRRGHRFDSR